ncbi:dihydrolipoyl dehydrogenase family protein [Sanguibacter suaedae]|uniref:NAD(P)/FAD-dependent oxidoreductase n=1 Tax=Sanguibacter suaedae TaxID=2795737 RepID=A0A934M9Q0_9MICO|nr:NAD(P)/FAD-dependent oxidoreductase [Sanguibacter suaedae]MBI9113396.1 NAD(P)/FAD-dependent oxidoreductase [Sanguibacter suaedae]
MTHEARTDQTDELTYDVVVVGAGAVGENAADRAGRTGLSVAVVEDELVGGECSYWACMPSKALLRPGAVLEAARRVPGAAGLVPQDRVPRVDVASTLGRRDSFASQWDDASQVEWLDGAGITLVRGRARLVGPRRLEVTGADGSTRTLVARCAVVLATGSVPTIPDVDGLAAALPWTSREATAAQDVPRRLAIIGGGVVAVEMATAFSDLGSAVTLLVRGDRLLPGTEPFVSDALVASLRDLGVDVRLGTQATSVRRETTAEAGPAGEVHLRLDGSGSVLVADEVLVAAGRRPATAGLGLDTVGLTADDPDAGPHLEVDDAMQVQGVDGGWLFAAGDAAGRVATTHQGKYEARVVGDVIAARFGDSDEAAEDGARAWSRFRATADHEAVPQVVFTRPEVAAVGLTEAAARDAGYTVRTVRYDLGSVAGTAVNGDGTEGTAQLVLDEDRGVVLGATFVGPDVAELLHAATIAVVGQVPLDRLWHAVPAYPTVSEVWLRLLETAGL